jgi:hypothetical protein
MSLDHSVLGVRSARSRRESSNDVLHQQHMMFDNLEATKANTERILTLLEGDDRQLDDVEAMAIS